MKLISDFFYRVFNPESRDVYKPGDALFYYRPKSYDRFIIDEVWVEDEYFLTQIRNMPMGVIIDIGAHIGAFAIRVAKLFPENAIWAFEPSPDNFKLLLKNIESNKINRIKAIQKAITADKAAVLFFDKKHTGGHSLLPVDNGEILQFQVESISLNDFIRENKIEKISYLKIDCEGSEYQILEGLSPENRNKIHYLGVEFHPVPGYDAIASMERIQGQNFRLLRQKEGYIPGQYTAIFEQNHA